MNDVTPHRVGELLNAIPGLAKLANVVDRDGGIESHRGELVRLITRAERSNRDLDACEAFCDAVTWLRSLGRREVSP